MASPIDQQLARYGARDVTVLLCQGLHRALPYAQPLPIVLSMGDLVRRVSGGTDARVLERAQALAAEERVRKSLWVATGLDAGDGIVSILTSLKSALALYTQHKKGKAAAEGLPEPSAALAAKVGADQPTDWETFQAQDAVLKALALSHLLCRLFPQEPDPVPMLCRLEAGRGLMAYFAAAELALPLLDQTLDGDDLLAGLIPLHIDSQAARLSPVIGGPAVDEARKTLPRLVQLIDGLVHQTRDHVAPLAAAAEERLATALRIAENVGDVVAAGVDVLPMYRYLGTELVAEACAWQAAREHDALLADPVAEEWLERHLPPEPVAQPEPSTEVGAAEVAAAEIAAAEVVAPDVAAAEVVAPDVAAAGPAADGMAAPSAAAPTPAPVEDPPDDWVRGSSGAAAGAVAGATAAAVGAAGAAFAAPAAPPAGPVTPPAGSGAPPAAPSLGPETPAVAPPRAGGSPFEAPSAPMGAVAPTPLVPTPAAGAGAPPPIPSGLDPVDPPALVTPAVSATASAPSASVAPPPLPGRLADPRTPPALSPAAAPAAPRTPPATPPSLAASPPAPAPALSPAPAPALSPAAAPATPPTPPRTPPATPPATPPTAAPSPRLRLRDTPGAPSAAAPAPARSARRGPTPPPRAAPAASPRAAAAASPRAAAAASPRAGRRGAPPPATKPATPAASPPARSATPAPPPKKGLSMTAIAVIVGLVAVLGCGGVLAVGGVGGVAWLANQEAGDKSGGSSTKKKKPSSSKKPSSGKKKKSGRSGGRGDRRPGRR